MVDLAVALNDRRTIPGCIIEDLRAKGNEAKGTIVMADLLTEGDGSSRGAAKKIVQL